MEKNTLGCSVFAAGLFVLLILSLAACSIPSAQAVSANDPPVVLQPTPVPQIQPTPAGDIYLSEKDSGMTVSIHTGETLVVTLEGNIATGYNWEAVRGDHPLLEQIGDPHVEPYSSLPGAGGKISLTFKAVALGQQTLKLIYHRIWEKDVPPQKTFEAVIIISEVSGTPAASSNEPPAPNPAQAVVTYPLDGMKGWTTYIDQDYGFSLQYPPEWKLEEAQGILEGHAIWLIPNTTRLARLQVAFRRANEDIQLSRSGLGSGELVPAGKVLFLGEEIQRQVLVFEGKHMTVMYTCPGCMQRGDLVYDFDLDYLGNWNDPAALPEEVEVDADLIIASVQLVETSP
ncbi:MAG TPA: protease inhibitor I42 family protein [Anaerolineaceae bacterium]|nr:protease inhibitor I42 family protein [Anaerolineaceae bacterium]